MLSSWLLYTRCLKAQPGICVAYQKRLKCIWPKPIACNDYFLIGTTEVVQSGCRTMPVALCLLCRASAKQRASLFLILSQSLAERLSATIQCLFLMSSLGALDILAIAIFAFTTYMRFNDLASFLESMRGTSVNHAWWRIHRDP